MYSATDQEGEKFKCAGNEFVMMLPRDVTGCCEVVLETVQPGKKTPPNAHSTFNQIYIILSGEPSVTVGTETRILPPLSVVYIAKNTNHYVVNSGKTEVKYLYVTVWPSGIPSAEIEGGWKNVYKRMIQEYVDRGFAVE
jgi:mannose-6-phosphate isomerase-like protein (cupin superfamily)